MSTHKYLEIFCCLLLVFAILLTVIFCHGEALGLQAVSRTLGYESRIFDTSKVHSIDITMDNWDSFLETCENEEYAACAVTIDGETFQNVAIRAKGNTSLSQVSSMDSDRYSFKIEFDQYDSALSYHGLDKLVLNNIIQDNTYMKDFLVYQMMEEFGVAAPLCSYSYITVNGEDWGLYLSVEAVEDSFLQRNYGSGFGDLYKPDSMSMGGGRGNGKDFDMDEFHDQEENSETGESFTIPFKNSNPEPPEGMEIPENFDPSSIDTENSPEMLDASNRGGFGGGMGSTDVKLQYIDDDADSYSNIFDSAKTVVTEADQNRLIASLKDLSNYENLETVLDMDAVLRYFVVHNFVVNGDSYTGSMIHNYYLYEENGALSMIPWDYNLAYGTFQGNNASSAVNDSIDSPLSVSDDRPMAAWMFSSDEYTELYHQYFEDFVAQFIDSGKLENWIDSTSLLIASYVEKDPSKFCTYEDFEIGVSTIRSFCQLRGESVKAQLNGSEEIIDASSLNLSDMGTMNMGGGERGGNFGGGNRGENSPQRPTFGKNTVETTNSPPTSEQSAENAQTKPQIPEEMELPENFDPASMANGQMPQIPENSSEEKSNPVTDMTLELAPEHTDRETRSPSHSSPLEQPNSPNAAPLLAASAVVLLLGLTIAWKFRR